MDNGNFSKNVRGLKDPWGTGDLCGQRRCQKGNANRRVSGRTTTGSPRKTGNVEGDQNGNDNGKHIIYDPFKNCPSYNVKAKLNRTRPHLKTYIFTKNWK